MRRALTLSAVLLLAGCASGPSQRAAGPQPDEGEPVVPPAARIAYERAVSMMSAGELVDAELGFQAFLLEYPDYPGAHVNLAILFAARGDDLAAEASLQDALAIDPDHPAALNQLGMLYRRQGKFAEAEAAYNKAIEARPDYALAQYNLGVLNDLYLQRLEQALVHYERYQELTGEDPQVAKWIADLKRRIGTQRTANVTE